MINTAPSRSLARRTRQLLLYAFIFGTVGVFVTAVGIFLFFVPFAAQGTTGDQVQGVISIVLLVAGVGVFLAGFGFAIRALTRRRENDLALITGEHLSQYLDERYQFIRNINQPKLGYIDAVLVGPPGLLVFRIMNTAGEFLNERDGWVRKNKQNEWTPTVVNPTKEALVDMEAVRTYLATHQLDELEVYGVVVFVTEPPITTFKTRAADLPVASLSTLLETLKPNYLALERMNPKTVKRVTRLLLGERQ